MKQELLELILKDLPNQTAGVLKEYLDKSEKLEKENLELTKNLEIVVVEKAKCDIEVGELKKEITELQENLTNKKVKENSLKAREDKVAEHERLLDVTILEHKLIESMKRSEDIKELTALMVRNTSFKKKIIEETPVVRQTYASEYNNNTGSYINTPNGDYVEGQLKETITESEEI
jgi:hypothetical protein